MEVSAWRIGWPQYVDLAAGLKSNGRGVTEQKAFKLKEAVTVFGDEEQTRPLYTIKADRVFDISAQHNIDDMAGQPVGMIG